VNVENHANWVVGWRLPMTGSLAGGGLIVYCAQFNGDIVLLEGSLPFAINVYDDDDRVIKDGLGPNGVGLPFAPLLPTAPDGDFGATGPYFALNEFQAVFVEKLDGNLIEPARLSIWCKFNAGNYEYLQRWDFHADGRIECGVGLGGRLLFANVSHIHNFYWRLNFNLNDAAGLVVERKVRAGASTTWVPLINEARQSVTPSEYTRWRVRSASRTNAQGRPRSYEIIPASVDPPDGTYSTGDFWAINRKGAEMEMGYEVAQNDDPNKATDNHLVFGYGTGSPLGKEVICWYVMREHHVPAPDGEDRTMVPYHFDSFIIRPRDFLDDTPKSLYTTNPPSP
jgi:primary-amine oxidase